MSKKIKEHYVPKCYLELWCIPHKNQVYIFDKNQEKSRINHIDDVASERFFYDLNLTGLFEGEIERYGLKGIDLSKFDENQYIENIFANNIEGAYKDLLYRIINRTLNMTPWEIKNCYFISELDLVTFSIFMAFQDIRVKSIRSNIEDTSNCIQQILTDMNANENSINKYKISSSALKLVHGRMILNHEEICKIAHIFSNHLWILLVNRTNEPFYTSDNPIGTTAHIHDSVLGMNGINNKGVEIYFPLSPNVLLLLFERSYHQDLLKYDRHVVEIFDTAVVEKYNSKCTINALRCVISNNNDFSTIDRIIAKSPGILQKPKTLMIWGDKEYVPVKKIPR